MAMKRILETRKSTLRLKAALLSRYQQAVSSKDEIERQVEDQENNFKELETIYSKVIEEIQTEPKLSKFEDDIARIWDSRVKINSFIRLLLDKIQEVKGEMTKMQDQFNATLKTKEGDAQVIQDLKQEIDKGLQTIEALQAAELAAEETATGLREQIAVLNSEIDGLKKQMEAEDGGGLPAAKSKESHNREKERLLNEIDNLKVELKEATDYRRRVENSCETMDEEMIKLKMELGQAVNEKVKQIKFRETLEMDLESTRKGYLDKCIEIKEFENQHAKIQQEYNELDHQYIQLKISYDRQTLLNDQTAHRAVKLQDELVQTQTKLKQIDQEYLLVKTQYTSNQASDAEIGKLTGLTRKFEKSKLMYQNRLENVEKAKKALETDNEKLKEKLVNLERNIENYKTMLTQEKRHFKQKVSDYELLEKKLYQHQETIEGLQKLLAELDKEKQELARKNNKLEDDLNKQKQLKQAKCQDLSVNQARQQEVGKTNEELAKIIREREAEIESLKTNRNLMLYRTKHDVITIEQLGNEKLIVQKRLLQAQDDINTFKSKLKVINHQVEQLKEDITYRQNQLIREQNLREKIQKEKEHLSAECKQARADNDLVRKTNARLENEMNDLNKAMSDVETRRDELEKQVNQLLDARDILGVKLLRTERTLALTNEKARIYEITLHKGKIWYNRKLKEIQLLKLEIKHLRQEKTLMKRSIDNTANIRSEMFYLQRDLCREKVKCRVLEEELQNPLNVHRWRKLEKRIVLQNQNLLRQERRFQNLLRLQIKLQTMLSKQPSVEEVNQLVSYKYLVKEKNGHIKFLATCNSSNLLA
ncbi:hypothetical protein M8J75_008037 [Diaphorina citri]|nr:hypothetical protein M8J75_008037 [Diaphorina citri]